MKVLYFISIAICLHLISSCSSAAKNYMPVQIRDTFRLPGIPSAKTIYFNDRNVYYQSMDSPGRETFKNFSLQNNKVVWSKDINKAGINEGAITSMKEYVVPTLSDTVYLINEQGKARILKLEYRSKNNPLVYDNTFILQDRGVGLKCFNAKTLQQIWLIKQQSSFTMSQPLLMDSNIIYILDDKSIRSSSAATGKLNWFVTFRDTLSLYDLYSSYQDMIFVLSTNLREDKQIMAIDYKTGNLYWQGMIDNSVNVFERDMIVSKDKLFCRGDSSVFTYSLKDGKFLRKYDYKSIITTNLVADKGGNVLFGLDNNTLMKIDSRGKEFPATIFKSKLNRLYLFNDVIFLFSYPNLYSLKIEP